MTLYTYLFLVALNLYVADYPEIEGVNGFTLHWKDILNLIVGDTLLICDGQLLGGLSGADVKYFESTPEKTELTKINVIDRFDWQAIFTDNFEFDEMFLRENGPIVTFEFNEVYISQLSNVELPTESFVGGDNLIYDILVREHKAVRNDDDSVTDTILEYKTLVSDEVIENHDYARAKVVIKNEPTSIRIIIRFDFYGYEI